MNNLTLENFLNLLFEDTENTCYTDSPTGYRVYSYPALRDVFFCINALHPTQDLKPDQSWHRSDLPRRADHNVITHRNFLIELDGLPLSEQINYVTQKIPVSSITYSGGKSYHFIISLVEPVSAEKYRELALRLHTLLPLADKSCKNPSRLSRIPTAIRKDTGNEQTLVQLGNRIPVQDLENVLPLVEVKVQNKPMSREFISAKVNHAVGNPVEAMNEMNIDSRNRFFFWLGQRLKDLDISEESKVILVDTAYGNLTNTTGFSVSEAYNAARLK